MMSQVPSKKIVVQLVSASPVRRAVLLERLERTGVDASAVSPEEALAGAVGSAEVLLLHTDVGEAQAERLRAESPARALVVMVRGRGDQTRHELAAIDEQDLASGLQAMLTGLASAHPLGRLHDLARLVQAEIGASRPGAADADGRGLPGVAAAPGDDSLASRVNAEAPAPSCGGSPGDHGAGSPGSLPTAAAGAIHGQRPGIAAPSPPADRRLALLYERAMRDDYVALLGLGAPAGAAPPPGSGSSPGAWPSAQVQRRCDELLGELASVPCVVRGDHERLRFVEDAVEVARCTLTDPELRQAWLDGRGPRRDDSRSPDRAP